MNTKERWNLVYQTKAPDDVSWFQARPVNSLKLINASGVSKTAAIIDVGGGTSLLVDSLLDDGFTNVAVLDISTVALAHAKLRLGARASAVEWWESDVTTFDAAGRFGLWHDRAVFHFLTDETSRRQYVESLRRALTPGAHVIIATFAIGGPLTCSGLDVVRYDAPAICSEFGAEFQLLEQTDETHHTPWKTEQKFSYFRFRRAA